MKNPPLTRDNTQQPWRTNLNNPISRTQLEKSNQVIALKEQKMSKTELEIRSSSIINRILDNCKLKVVPQRDKPFTKKNKVHLKYSVNKKKIEKQQQPFSKTIKSILTEIPEPCENTKNKRRSFSCVKPTFKVQQGKQIELNRRLSMSGLVDYNFKSILSKNRLAINPSGAQSQMENQIQSAKKRSMASLIREGKIRAKTESSHEYSQTQKVISKIIDNQSVQGSTNTYLKNVLKEKRNSTMIYGRESKEYHSLKKMSKQFSDLQEAMFMMDEIKKHFHQSPKKEKINSNKPLKTNTSEQKVFQNRKRPSSKNRVYVPKHYSIQNQ